MDWTYKGEAITELPDGCVGFVYLIEDKISGKGYIGKKLATFARTKVVKGKKKKVRVASDWLKYYGSNDALKAEVVKHGEEHFERKILHICYTKTDCNYLEAREQFDHRVLENPDRWYNAWIMVRVRASQLKLQECQPQNTQSSSTAETPTASPNTGRSTKTTRTSSASKKNSGKSASSASS